MVAKTKLVRFSVRNGAPGARTRNWAVAWNPLACPVTATRYCPAGAVARVEMPEKLASPEALAVADAGLNSPAGVEVRTSASPDRKPPALIDTGAGTVAVEVLAPSVMPVW